MSENTSTAPDSLDPSQEDPAEKQARRERVWEKTNKAIEHLAAVDLSAAASLLRIAKIEVTDDHQRVPTACLAKDGETTFRILMNERFCDRPQRDVTCILLHELLHHIMRHLDDSGKIGESPHLSNVVADAFINRIIYLLNPSLATFFRDFYSAQKSPDLFLRSRANPATVLDQQIYRALYKGNVTEADLYQYLKSQGMETIPPKVILIGSGEDEGENPIDEENLPSLAAEIGEQVKGSEQGDELAAKFEELIKKFVKSRRLPRVAGIEEVFRNSIIESCKAQVVESIVGDVRDLPNRQVFMPENLQRQDLIMLMAGVDLYLWRCLDPDKKHGSVNVYLDVSGSMGREIEFIYGCCVAFEEYLNTDIYLFSNKIDSITIEELRNGKVSSTMGTDFDCVVEHFVETDAEKAIIFTDGYARLQNDLAVELENSSKTINGVVTSRGSSRTLKKFCKDVFRIPKELSE